MERKKLVAAEGMVLCNGVVFGREVYPGTEDDPKNWKEIPLEEAENLCLHSREHGGMTAY